jgi:hypothetical protein
MKFLLKSKNLSRNDELLSYPSFSRLNHIIPKQTTKLFLIEYEISAFRTYSATHSNVITKSYVYYRLSPLPILRTNSSYDSKQFTK